MEKIQIGHKTFNVEIADTDKKRQIGLSKTDFLPNNQGMLFLFDDTQDEVSFTMEDTSIPLDIVFIDEDGDVISVAKGEPFNKEPYVEDDVAYVLEVNQNSGISENDFLVLEENESSKSMQVLDSKGKIQFTVEDGNRIVSRKETKVLIRKAKKANKLKTDSSYRALGRYLFMVFNKQDNRDAEYTTIRTT